MSIKLVILDRDGVVNVDRPDYVKSLDELELITGSAKAIRLLNATGIPVVIATNQACVGKGIITEDDLEEIHQHLQYLLWAEGAEIQQIYYCPDVENPQYRKPAPGMLLEAMQDFHASPAQTVMIGDALRDLEAAQAAGCQAILVRTGKGRQTVSSLSEPQRQTVRIYDTLYKAVQDVLALKIL